MTKNEIIHSLANRASLTLSEATKATDALFGIITDALVSGDGVTVRGFAAIYTVPRPVKVVRNIQTGASFTMPPGRRVKFAAYRQLQALIDNPADNATDNANDNPTDNPTDNG